MLDPAGVVLPAGSMPEHMESKSTSCRTVFFQMCVMGKGMLCSPSERPGNSSGADGADEAAGVCTDMADAMGAGADAAGVAAGALPKPKAPAAEPAHVYIIMP